MTKSCLLVSGGTAGHVLPSLEIAKSLIKQGFHVHWLGHGEKLEYQIHSENITYHRVLSRSPRSKVLWNIAYWKLLASDMKVIRNLLRTYKFQFTLVTGNFISILPGLLSRYYKVPLYIYEQNSIIGQANRLLSPFSKKIFWGMHPLRKLSKKEVYTSQPLRDEILTLKQDLDLYRPQSRRNKKTILIMGGSLGAGFFNSTLVEHLAAVKNIHAWQIIHCAGRSQHVSNVQKKYQICKSRKLLSNH